MFLSRKYYIHIYTVVMDLLGSPGVIFPALIEVPLYECIRI